MLTVKQCPPTYPYGLPTSGLKSKGPCVEWWGAFSPSGYGRMSQGGVRRVAHRQIYEECFGDIPEGYVLHHSCGRKSCVNPDHLVAMTQSQHVEIHRLDMAQPPLTFCKRGHPFDDENTLFTPAGVRSCKACKRSPEQRIKQKQRNVAYYQANREVLIAKNRQYRERKKDAAC